MYLRETGSGQVAVVGCCEYGNERSIKDREFLDYLSVY